RYPRTPPITLNPLLDSSISSSDTVTSAHAPRSSNTTIPPDLHYVAAPPAGCSRGLRLCMAAGRWDRPCFGGDEEPRLERQGPRLLGSAPAAGAARHLAHHRHPLSDRDRLS